MSVAIRNAVWAKQFEPDYIPSASQNSEVDLKWGEAKNHIADEALREAMERKRKEAKERARQ